MKFKSFSQKRSKFKRLMGRPFSWIRILMGRYFLMRFWSFFSIGYLFLNGAKTSIDLRVYGGVLRVTNFGYLSIGSGVRINSGPAMNYVGGNNKTSIWVGDGANVSISDNVRMSGVTIVSFESISIGTETFLGGGVSIFDNDFHPISSEDRRHNPSNISKHSVEIGNRCFIGFNSVILKGVRIGDDSVIAAGSVVSKDIPSGEIWGGNPAKKIR